MSEETVQIVNTDFVATRNRKILMEVLSGTKKDKIAIRYGLSVQEVDECFAAAFDDMRAADFHKDVRAVLINKILGNIEKIENWMSQLNPKYKRFHQQLDIHGKKRELWEETDDHLAFVKFQAELRNQYALLRQILGAELPEETKDVKADIQRKMMDALTMTITMAKEANEERRGDTEKVINVETE